MWGRLRRIGNPSAEPQWNAALARVRVNTAVEKSRRFDQARADFEGAWRAFSSKRTEADYQAWESTRLDRTQVCKVEAR